MKTVIILNGKPRSGKDTAIKMMQDLLMVAKVPVEWFSSIDPVRDMLTNAKFDLSQKTQADRDLMAEVGDAVEKHSGYRSKMCVFKVLDFFEAHPDSAVMFLHVREKLVIDRVKQMLAGWPTGPYAVTTIFLNSPHGIDVTSNAADRDVHLVDYDHQIDNTGSLDDLARACDRMLVKLGLIDQLSLLH